jgi:hypothetical protein
VEEVIVADGLFKEEKRNEFRGPRFALYPRRQSLQTSGSASRNSVRQAFYLSLQKSIMDIQIATLCDFAADYNGKLVISGTFDTLAARAMPVVHPSCALAMRFCFTPEDAGRHKLSINIINEDGESLDPNNMPIEPEFDVALPKNVPFLTRNIVMNLQGLRFEEDGIYSIDIGCDGEILMRLPLRIVIMNQGPNGETQMA